MAAEITSEKIFSKEEETAAQEEIWKYIFGFTPMAVIKCAIELGIPDILESHESPMTLADLTSEIGCSESSLYRIMRFLIHYKNTAKIYGDLMLRIPVKTSFSTNGMACGVRVTVPAVLEGCAEMFEGLTTLVDVGGGDGTTLRLIVEACPWIEGINFDLPHVVSVAPAIKGVEHVGGNMFVHVPKADAVYLMKVIHDWADEDCINILRKCREAIPQDTGKVIIVDAIVGREEDHEFKGVGLLFDMAMIAHTSTGKERTLNEWANLFRAAGFTRYTIKHIPAYPSVFQVYP